ncbi:MAG: isoprenylcysteine carboxylmethyltransferase family protein [Anaerolineales bacterium]|nr:isoprenylcysteine carboxylmethyltransferase family protein [Anaerolineales bacterium]
MLLNPLGNPKGILYLVFTGFGWLAFRVVVRRDYLQTGKLSAPSAFLEVLVLFIHGVISYLYMGSDFPSMPPLEPNPEINLVGFTLIGAGLAGTLTAMTRLGFGVSVGQAAGSIRRTGLYAFTRNPRIIFYTVLLLGYCLLWTNWLTLLWLAAFLFVGHMMIVTEEEYLLETYGQEYADYCREVPRYLFSTRQPRKD